MAQHINESAPFTRLDAGDERDGQRGHDDTREREQRTRYRGWTPRRLS
jgi:hypothetical protein